MLKFFGIFFFMEDYFLFDYIFFLYLNDKLIKGFFFVYGFYKFMKYIL